MWRLKRSSNIDVDIYQYVQEYDTDGNKHVNEAALENVIIDL